MEYPINALLRSWLEKHGRHDLVDKGSVELDQATIDKLYDECERLHPDYDEETCLAWAIFSATTRKSVPKAEQTAIGKEASTGVSRVAASVDDQTREFRALRGAFDNQHKATGKVEDAIVALQELEKTATDSIIATIGNGIEQLDGGIRRGVEAVLSSVNEALADLNAEVKHGSDQRAHAFAVASVERKWLWAWRVAIILALMGLLALKGHAQAPAGVTHKGHESSGLNTGVSTDKTVHTPMPTTVIPLADASKVELLKLIRDQDKLLMRRKDRQIEINDLDKQIDKLASEINQSAQKVAETDKIDTSTLVLDLDKLAWVSKSE